ncbi:DUF1345 domain-containing protein [Fibrisoma montanum]|uniref:DUF1345 domain-containing protein n=1 Tax=Fibrisoma montanum TaxID=2305895 RepID=A0A418LYX0_9BACT|nr:DUF1345 domain-containing protein [Fibrisoma montanum]RIV18459.1 DUF1345 domain-containing protein [Fibrisoma montanum]
MTAYIHRISRLDAHHRLLIALGVMLLVLAFLPDTLNWPDRITILWVSYASTVLSLMWTSILNAHPRELPKLSRIQDSSRTFIFLFIVFAAVASLSAVVALLNAMNDRHRGEHSLLALLAVVCSWSLVHTVFTLRYAHLYYGDSPHLAKPVGGLDFPREPEPDYLDFAYFAFVIGMTSQVSDVQITSRPMRRTALLHGVLSFGFNTVIIALSINALAGVL